MKRLTDRFDLGWVAGFYEGEGSCYCRVPPGKALIQVQIIQKNIEPLLKIKEILDCGVIYPVRKTYFRFQLQGSDAEAFLGVVRPFLSRRRQEQIELVLLRWNTRRRRADRVRDISGRYRSYGYNVVPTLPQVIGS